MKGVIMEWFKIAGLEVLMLQQQAKEMPPNYMLGEYFLGKRLAGDLQGWAVTEMWKFLSKKKKKRHKKKREKSKQ